MNFWFQYPIITLKYFQQAAIKCYGMPLAPGAYIPFTRPFKLENIDPENNPAEKVTFHDRVHYRVVAELIKNTVMTADWDAIMFHHDKFWFIDSTNGVMKYDGPMILKVIFDKIDPSSQVSGDTLQSNIQNACLHAFNNDVDLMSTYIEENFWKILD